MSYSEFVQWDAFNKISPGGHERGDMQAALIAATTANAMSGRPGRRAKLQDFMLRFQTRVANTRDGVMRDVKGFFGNLRKKKSK